MEELTGLGKAILTTEKTRIKLDKSVKNILAYKPLLARIFKEVVSECANMTFEEIEDCIEGEVKISSEYVDGGISNVGERITGQDTESFISGEGFDRFDIKTCLRIPQKEKEHIKLIINVEAQNEDKPGYDIPLRALFYCCMMISAQQGVEFTTDSDDPVKYGNIKKVYSIWLCTETAQKRANSIEKYIINRSFLVGHNSDYPRYDILNAIIINISAKHETENTDNELIKMLTDLFNDEMDGAGKIKRLKDCYGLRLTREVEEEVSTMCSYAVAMENKGREEGREEGRKEGIDTAVDRLSMYYMEKDPSLSKEEAIKMSESILRK